MTIVQALRGHPIRDAPTWLRVRVEHEAGRERWGINPSLFSLVVLSPLSMDVSTLLDSRQPQASRITSRGQDHGATDGRMYKRKSNRCILMGLIRVIRSIIGLLV